MAVRSSIFVLRCNPRNGEAGYAVDVHIGRSSGRPPQTNVNVGHSTDLGLVHPNSLLHVAHIGDYTGGLSSTPGHRRSPRPQGTVTDVPVTLRIPTESVFDQSFQFLPRVVKNPEITQLFFGAAHRRSCRTTAFLPPSR